MKAANYKLIVITLFALSSWAQSVKLKVTPATASAHLRILRDAGLIGSTRIGKWTYFKRNDAALLEFSKSLAEL